MKTPIVMNASSAARTGPSQRSSRSKSRSTRGIGRYFAWVRMSCSRSAVFSSLATSSWIGAIKAMNFALSGW